jgi:hypothetical protein
MNDLDRLRDARALLARAQELLDDLLARAPGLTAATNWRSKAAAEFRLTVDEWHTLLRWLGEELVSWEQWLIQLEGRAQAAAGAAAAESVGAR